MILTVAICLFLWEVQRMERIQAGRWEEGREAAALAAGKSILAQTSTVCKRYFKWIKGIWKRRLLLKKTKLSFCREAFLPSSVSFLALRAEL